MSQGLVTAAYIISAVLFILALAGLSKQETAKRGNLSGIIGMIIALIATIFGPHFTAVGFGLIVVAMIIGALIGVRLALKVEMTGMPELIAMLHSFVGFAAVLVGFCTYINFVNAESIELPAAETETVATTATGSNEGYPLCNVLAQAKMFNAKGCNNLINQYVAEYNNGIAVVHNATGIARANAWHVAKGRGIRIVEHDGLSWHQLYGVERGVAVEFLMGGFVGDVRLLIVFIDLDIGQQPLVVFLGKSVKAGKIGRFAKLSSSLTVFIKIADLPVFQSQTTQLPGICGIGIEGESFCLPASLPSLMSNRISSGGIPIDRVTLKGHLQRVCHGKISCLLTATYPEDDHHCNDGHQQQHQNGHAVGFL